MSTTSTFLVGHGVIFGSLKKKKRMIQIGTNLVGQLLRKVQLLNQRRVMPHFTNMTLFPSDITYWGFFG